MKLVSIIIPVYNSERYVKETVESALAQTWPHKEIIVVDDGSTDGSVSVVKKFVPLGVRLIKQENRGACVARNQGLCVARGDYIQFLDADDLLHPDKIRIQMEALAGFDETVVASGRWAKFADQLANASFQDKQVNKCYDCARGWLIDSWEGKGSGVVHSWLCHRDLIQKAGDWDDTLLLNQDGEFFCRVLLAASSIIYCEKSIAFYRKSSLPSISKGRNEEKAASLLASYISYEHHTLKVEDSGPMRHALMKNFLNFIYEFYPAYPDLLKVAEEHIRGLGFTRFEVTGGKNFRRLARVVGFYPALKLRNIFGGTQKN